MSAGNNRASRGCSVGGGLGCALCLAAIAGEPRIIRSNPKRRPFLDVLNRLSASVKAVRPGWAPKFVLR